MGIPTMWVGAVTHDGGVVQTKVPPEADRNLRDRGQPKAHIYSLRFVFCIFVLPQR